MKPNIQFKIKNLFFLSLLCFYTPSIFAYLCPTNFKSVQPGDSQKVVEASCGKPNKTQELPAEKKSTPEQWDYVIQDQSYGKRNKQNNKLSLLFDANSKLISMTLDGASLDQFSACQSKIQIGDLKDAVQRSCGSPNFVLQSQENNPTTTTTEPTSVLWIYETSTGTTRFLFKDGILTDRQ